MKLSTIICSQCEEPFQRANNEVARSKRKSQRSFCSKECFSAFITSKNSVTHQPNVRCALCQKQFYVNPSKKKGSKSGLYFCCRSHKDQAQRIGGIKEIMPPHYGTANGLHDARKLAFESYPHYCNRCHYENIPVILQVHHKDRDRSNNKLENLELLCPTCHIEEHYQAGDGLYHTRKGIVLIDS